MSQTKVQKTQENANKDRNTTKPDFKLKKNGFPGFDNKRKKQIK